MTNAIMPTYFFQLPVAFERGEGIWLYDAEGKKYLDGLCGISVTNLGHSHPVVTKAICDQAAKLIHTSNTYQIPAQQALAQKLVELSGMDQVYFCNSGAEANEAAVKISRMFARKKNIPNPAIVVMENGFHGRTMGVVGACNKRIRGGFEPFLPDFIRVAFDDLDAIKAVAKQYENIVAVMVEPIQGESGVYIPSENYLKGIREICDQQDWLMILDEVQTGLGRTGKWFDCQHANILPDIMTLAKSLAGGLPIGACLARGKASNMFSPGKHGTTFGGNPLVCTAAMAVLNTLEKDNIIKNSEKMGNYLVKKLKETLGKNSAVKDVRGRGLMIGIELDRPCRDLMAIGLKHGMLFIISADKVIRLLPPLIITQADADEIVKRLNSVIGEFTANG